MASDAPSKSVLASKSIQGVIVAVLPFLLPALGVSFSEDQAHLIAENVDKVFMAVGAIWSVVGLRLAKADIKLFG